jgi:hypothetical protein
MAKGYGKKVGSRKSYGSANRKDVDQGLREMAYGKSKKGSAVPSVKDGEALTSR